MRIEIDYEGFLGYLYDTTELDEECSVERRSIAISRLDDSIDKVKINNYKLMQTKPHKYCIELFHRHADEALWRLRKDGEISPQESDRVNNKYRPFEQGWNFEELVPYYGTAVGIWAGISVGLYIIFSVLVRIIRWVRSGFSGKES